MSPDRLAGQDFTALELTETDGYLLARMNRPEVRNAIDAQMIDEFHAVCDYLERTPKILIIIGTTVNGKGLFASGADIAQLRERRRNDALAGINSRCFARIAKLPMPVIAALDGWTLGGGAELAYAADFRIGTPSVKIGQPEASLGISPAAGALWRLRELVGEPLAKEMILAGRVLDSDEALACHLITRRVEAAELEAAAIELAEQIGRQDPLAVRISKAVYALPREAHPVVDELAQAVLFESPAKFERMQAFLDRKKK